MSITHKGVVRRKDANIEDYNLPQWDRDGNLIGPAKKPEKVTEVEDIPEQDVQMPTLADVEAIRESAYNEGFEQGYESGMKEGHRVGEQNGRQQGEERGYQEGLEKGQQEGLAQALQSEQEKTDQKLKVLDAAANALKEQLSQEQTELQEALLALSVRIARQVIQDELRLEKAHIEKVVHASIQSLPNPDEKLTLQIHPDDYDVVSQFAESHWSLETSAEITPGGCRVKSGYSLIDYTLEHRFTTAVAHFLTELDTVDAEKLSAPLTEQSLMPNDAGSNSESSPVESSVTASDPPELEQVPMDPSDTHPNDTSVPDESEPSKPDPTVERNSPGDPVQQEPDKKEAAKVLASDESSPSLKQSAEVDTDEPDSTE